jgi:uncharacterized membrane protein YeaQ/YmgE (transglycosylase-associated protein family)
LRIDSEIIRFGRAAHQLDSAQKKLLTCGFVLTSHPKKLIIGGIAATAMIITAAPAEGAPRPESEPAAMPDGSFEQYPGQYPRWSTGRCQPQPGAFVDDRGGYVTSIPTDPGGNMEFSLIGIIMAIVVGAIVGVLARLVLPGRQNISIILTIVVGIASALIGTLIARALGVATETKGIDWIELLIQVLVAVVGVAIVSAVMGRRRGTLRR